MKYLIIAVTAVILLTSCGHRPPEPPQSFSGQAGFKLEFTAQDIYANTVTEESFGDKKVYFIYLWATWCGACVQGMPELAEIARNYADDVGFIGLLSDFETDAARAVDIIESAGIPDSFIMINANEPSVSELLEAVTTGFVPSVVLLTEEGFSQPVRPPYSAAIDEALL
jgi:thiol-disulfide isomerase/thioredoxin